MYKVIKPFIVKNSGRIDSHHGEYITTDIDDIVVVCNELDKEGKHLCFYGCHLYGFKLSDEQINEFLVKIEEM